MTPLIMKDAAHVNDGNIASSTAAHKKRPLHCWSGMLAKSSGEEGNHYIEGDVFAAGCCCALALFDISFISTRRFAARPSRVLLS